MTQDGKRHHDMSIEEILKSIKGVIDNHDGVLKNNEDDILELTDIIEDNSDINDSGKTTKEVQNNRLEASMLSEETALKTSEILKHFSKAAKTMHASYPNNKTDTLEEIVIKMLRPEISKWLEANLPLLVKQLVEKEIQKLKPHD
jgi:cell pole-organizing protein PopZ